MNYHLMTDEKFTDDFIIDVERITSGNNLYYVQAPKEKLTHVKSEDVICVTSRVEALQADIIPKLKSNDKVFFHYLSEDLYRALLKIPSHIKIGMFFWGGEIVETPMYLYAEENYDPISYDFYIKNWHPISGYKKSRLNPLVLLRLLARKILFEFRMYNSQRLKTKALNRINYFFHWNELDYDWIKKRYPKFNAEFKYHYYGVGLDEDIPAHIEKNNNQLVFWLGNSATLSNNHLDALSVLSKFKDEDILIYCPLSYGQPKESVYRQTVIAEGKRLFKEKFVPLTDFMSRQKYYELLNEVDVVIMFHNRTQAAGNIFAFMKMGKKIFMKEQSTLFGLLVADNTPIYSAKTLNAIDFKTLATSLSNDEIKFNYNLLDNVIVNLNRKERTIKEILS